MADFDKILHNAIIELSQDENWDGNVECPTGAFTKVVLSSSEYAILTVVADEIGCENTAPERWVLRQNSDGVYDVQGYHEQVVFQSAMKALETRYVRWLDSTI